MIVLDTNVVSEPMKPRSDSHVVGWLDNQRAGTLFITSVTYAKLLVGVEKLPDGKRKEAMHKQAMRKEAMRKEAMRDVRPFEAAGVPVINPWLAET